MKHTKKAKIAEMHQQIETHGQNLNKIFNTNFEPAALCKKLFKIERLIHIETCAQCNDYYTQPTPMDYKTGRADFMHCDKEKSDLIIEGLQNKVFKILNCEGNEALKNAIFVNYDGRGYALKIRAQYVTAHKLQIYQDWGGFGIIAPDFTPDF